MKEFIITYLTTGKGPEYKATLTAELDRIRPERIEKAYEQAQKGAPAAFVLGMLAGLP
jgi:hypothetical protein